MKYQIIAMLALPMVLSACGGSNSGGVPSVTFVTTQASLATPDTTGTFPITFNNAIGSEVIDASGNGYAYQIGDVAGTANVLAQAGIVSGTSVATAPVSGSADLTGVYQVRTLTDLRVEDQMIDGYDYFQSSLITLTADFGAGTLTGDASNLEVDGRFSDGLLSGDVTFDGQSATLTGVVGADQAVGAFYGRDVDSVIAGGFNVSD